METSSRVRGVVHQCVGLVLSGSLAVVREVVGKESKGRAQEIFAKARYVKRAACEVGMRATIMGKP
jgi:hypothetical protein